ncbi:MAG: hypothetical protein D6731_15170 [Planctomycetota bacterium]|nr:MAG: hypothetical protein D6731_15170 [Planctomycetota bacterium]
MEVGSPYFVLLALGFGLGCGWFIRRGEAEGLPRVGLIDVCIAAIVFGLLGGRLLHIAVEPLPAHPLGAEARQALRERAQTLDPVGRAALEEALRRPVVPAVWEFVALMPPGSARDRAVALARERPAAVPARLWYRARPWEALMFWKGGLAYVGGLVLAVAGCFLVARRHGIPIRRGLDLAAAAVALGLVFGRLGCFLGGCCYGEVCAAAWWATPPPWYGPPAGGVPRYPTALLSAANAALLFGLLRALLPRRVVSGEVFLAFLALYAPGRFAIEALRADPRGGAGGLSTSQIAVLVGGVPAAVAWAVLRWTHRRPRPESAPPDHAAP